MTHNKELKFQKKVSFIWKYHHLQWHSEQIWLTVGAADLNSFYDKYVLVNE